MAAILIYDSKNTTVPGRVKSYADGRSRETFKVYSDRLDTPDVSAVKNVPMQYWKVVNLKVVEMNAQEKDAVDREARIGKYAVREKMEILSDIKSNLTPQRMLEVISAPFFAGFATVLEDYSYNTARFIRGAALAGGQITQSEHDTIDGMLPPEP